MNFVQKKADKRRSKRLEIKMGDSNISDEEFKDIVRNYPAVYKRSSVDFRDKNKKANSWRAIAESSKMDVSKAMARYNSIRIQFSR